MMVLWLFMTIKQHMKPYEDEDLEKFFEYVAAGYCWKQSTDKAGLDRERMDHTLWNDYDVKCHMIDLAMVAGKLIREGKIPVPDREDGLYEEFRGLYYKRFHKKYFKQQ